MSNLGDGSDIWDVVLGIADGLDVNGSSLVVDGSGNVGGILPFYPLDVDVELLEVDSELVIGTAIEPTCADKIVTRFHD